MPVVCGNHPVGNARSIGFLTYGVIGLFGFINRVSVRSRYLRVIAFLVRMTRCMRLMNDSRLLFQFSAAFPVIMPTMQFGVIICFQVGIRHHSCQGLSTDPTFTGVFSFLKHDNLMAHHVKAF